MDYEPQVGDMLMWGPTPAGLGMIVEKNLRGPPQCRILFCDGALYWYGSQSLWEAREKYINFRKKLQAHGN